MEVQLPPELGGEKMHAGSKVMCVEGTMLLKHKHRDRKQKGGWR